MKTTCFVKNFLFTIMIPAAVFVLFFILVPATGNGVFGNATDWQSILYNSVYAGLIALAMSVNLTSGRFDFATGATIVLDIILAGNIAKNLSMNGLGLIVVAIVIGAIIGLVSGLVYVVSGLPPMVVSLGLAMIYEAIGFVYNKAQGVKLIGKTSMLIFSKMPWAVVVIVLVLAVLVYLWDFSKFGYDRAALASGQKIAVDVGINEKKNAVICYVIAGALLGIAGCVYISKFGIISPETGLSSSSYFMNAFLPMFIGGAISKYSSHPIAVFMGAIAQAIIVSGLARLGLSNSAMNVMNGVIVMAFLVYTSNSHILVEQKMFKEKMETAKKAREAKEV